MPKDTFKQELALHYNEDDLSLYRNGSYAIAKENNSDTPDGILITRKDTSNSGGATAAKKLVDDIYNLYQYIEGDTSVDVSKLFTERSKALLRSQKTVIDELTDSKMKPVASENQMVLQEFLVELLQEMRQDRDIIRTELAEVKKNIALIRIV